jgi:N6-L-threonylcarbamoyladenine synthase
MIILGIETSCDETGVCLIKANENKIEILSNQLYSQIAKHKEFGGVMPMMAKREHAKNLVPLLEAGLKGAGLWKERGLSSLSSSLDKEGLRAVENILSREGDLFVELLKLLKTIKKPEIDVIAVTNGPGLEPALWVGVTFAQALSSAWNIPLIPTNHMEGHIVVSALDMIEKTKYIIKEIKYPAIALLISGGHTQLVLIKDKLKYEIVGNTRDDAVGEAYDKVARMLGLPYPGGKIISDLAQREMLESPNKKTSYPLPRPMIHSNDLNFSFSGLKTAVLYTLKRIPEITDQVKQEIALEFENVILDVLSKKTTKAIEQFGAQTLIIGGGVSANIKIRQKLEELCKEYQIDFLVPEINTSTDNALMIALAGYTNILAGQKPNANFKANGNLSL